MNTILTVGQIVTIKEAALNLYNYLTVSLKDYPVWLLAVDAGPDCIELFVTDFKDVTEELPAQWAGWPVRIKLDKGKKIVNDLEIALATAKFDGNMELVRQLSPVIDWFHKGEPVTAILEAKAVGLDKNMINVLKKIFDVRYYLEDN